MYNYVDYLEDDDMPIVANEDEGQDFSQGKSAQKSETADIGDEDDED